MRMCPCVRPFLCRGIRVEFKDEPGEGSGVVRSLLASAAEALLSQEPLPGPATTSKPKPAGMRTPPADNESDDGGISAESSADVASVASEVPSAAKEDGADPLLRPLFHTPGKPGYVSPVFAAADAEGSRFRLDWFEYSGILIGLSILHQHILPMNLCRHVLKFLLGRKIGWHDLAFFDPDLYESMRKTIVEASALSPEAFKGWELCFDVNLPGWLGGSAHELIPNGAKEPVTRENVHQYVALYAQYLMVDSVRPALEAMRAGLLSVMPAGTLQDLTAEDLRLLLNGCSDVDIQMLKKYTEFKNETGKDISYVEQTQAWFYQVTSQTP